MSPGIRIVRKRTVTETDGGGTVEQTAWQTLSNTLIQCEFEAVEPARSRVRAATGTMGIFFDRQIERVRFILTPSDLSQVNASAYKQMDLNLLEFEGTFLGTKNARFKNGLDVKPTFDKWEGWTFELSVSRDGWSAAPGKFDVQTTAERIAANCICTEAFKVSIGRRKPLGGELRISGYTDILFSVVLRDTEGLRQAIADIAGEAYLNRLLRMHGYEIDRDETTR
jgi:hypothetical protein